MSMAFVETVRWCATLTGIIAAVMVSLNLGARITGWGFVIFTASSIAWIYAGYLDDTPSLVTQNIVLTIINIVGVYRWLIRKA